ncbi:MAG: Bug family tripartite tricarboxylate transporter substrate binding protein [Burkholderiaceae bacterium]
MSLSLTGTASAQADYPGRQPVKLVVPFGAGSGVDQLARHVAEGLQRELGGNFVVDNRPGASGMIAASAVARAAPDGYTLLMASSSTHSSIGALVKNVSYDVERDFQPIANFIDADFFLVVRGDSEVKSVKDLVARIKAQPGKTAYGFGSVTTQVAGATFAKQAGLDSAATAYKSNPSALTDLLGGTIDWMFIDQTIGLQQIASGKIRPLAVAAQDRRSDLKDVPTTYESGYPFTITAWIGLMTPAGIPDEVRRKLSQATANLLRNEDMRARFVRSGRVAAPMSTEAYAAYLKQQRESWESKIRDAGIKPE